MADGWASPAIGFRAELVLSFERGGKKKRKEEKNWLVWGLNRGWWKRAVKVFGDWKLEFMELKGEAGDRGE